jgi:cytochrome c oxidase subunit 2
LRARNGKGQARLIRTRRPLASLFSVVAFPLAAALAGCGSTLGVPEPASEQGDDVLDLWRVLFWTAAVIGALVMGLILWAIFRYRARSAVDKLPTQTREHVRLELFYTAVPLLVVVVLFSVNVVAQDRVTKLAKHPDLLIEITGFQWQWRFDYVNEDVTVVGDIEHPPTLVLPVNRTVQLRLVSADVIHSFYVPAFLEKRDLIPGVDNAIDIRPTRVGRFVGHCAEFCGLAHDQMGFDVETMSPANFEAWLAEQTAEQARRAP